ncbi:MAG: hypothetical protein IPF55_19075 [Rhodoferax sp.]|nr:hypothetical protein [Rhodoferax sp.]
MKLAELRTTLIERACRLSLHAGADFLKTSTGKTPVSATALRRRTAVGFHCLASQAAGACDFKASGGIRYGGRTVYMALVAVLGTDARNPRRFRIGAGAS